MNYDFFVMSSDLLEGLEKKLKSFNKSVLKDCIFSINIINDSRANQKKQEIIASIADILTDQSNKSIILYTETMNKIKRVLEDNLIS